MTRPPLVGGPRRDYPDGVAPNTDRAARPSERAPSHVRDPLANRAAVLAARRRPMSERLELALSWNAVAAELRDNLGDRRR